MGKRKELTPKDIINKGHYRAILFLIDLFKDKKIKFIHLRYALVEKHKIILTTQTKQELSDFFGDVLEYLPRYGWFEKKIEGERGINNLTNFLLRLIEMEMIGKKKHKGERFPSYRLTKLGENISMRWYVEWMTAQLVPDEALVGLAEKIGEFIVHMDIDKLPISKKPDMLL